MTPIEWAKRPLLKYAEFSGRAPRAEFWWFTLAVIVISVILTIVEEALGLTIGEGLSAVGVASGAFTLGTLIPSIAVTARRLHDTGRSGWWMLIGILPYVIVFAIAGFMAVSTELGSGGEPGMGAVGAMGIGVILAIICGLALLVFLVLPGNKGPNAYGPDPYGGGDYETVFS